MIIWQRCTKEKFFAVFLGLVDVQAALAADNIKLNKRAHFASFISVSLKCIFYAYPYLCNVCCTAPSFTWGAEQAECARARDDVKIVLSCCQSRMWIFQTLWNRWHKNSAFFRGSFFFFFSCEPQTHSTCPLWAEWHLKICEGDLKRRDATWYRDSLLGWQQSGVCRRDRAATVFKKCTNTGRSWKLRERGATMR